MNIIINLESPVPVYQQVVHVVIEGIQNGDLCPATSLPSIRQLAGDLKLTTATVSKSYQILQKNKIIITGGRRGTFVSEDAVRQAEAYLQNELRWEMEEFISKQLKYSISIEQLEETFNQVISEIKEGESR